MNADTGKIRSAINILLLECPVTGNNPDFCPYCEIREKSLKERFEWLKSLEDDDLYNLFKYHNICLKSIHNFNI